MSEAPSASRTHSDRTPDKPRPPPPPTPPHPLEPAVPHTRSQVAALAAARHFPKASIQIPVVKTQTVPESMTTYVKPIEGMHRQVAAPSIDDASLDHCFQIIPKLHYIKSNTDETVQWLNTASFESILLELLCFALDQGHVQKEVEGQFEKELERAVANVERVESFEAFCTTFLKDGTFKPAGRVKLSGTGQGDKFGSLFRMINTDLQNLQRQQRVLGMVAKGTADHEVHTSAHHANLRRLVEDLVQVIYPNNERGTYSEVYKTMAESASFDGRQGQHLSSLKVVCLPDVMVPYGGNLLAGGVPVSCDALERRIRCKLPSVVIKMHFTDRSFEERMKCGTMDESGLGMSIDDVDGHQTPTTTRSKGKDDKGMKAEEKSSRSSTGSGSAGGSRGKRKQPDTETAPAGPRSKRHREDIQTHHSSDSHVINEVYGEHVSQLLCALTQAPMGYIKHQKYTVSPADERDGTACVSQLGLIVSGEEVYITKLDASQDYIDSMVETYRADHLHFSCLATPLYMYRASHLKALLMFLRFACTNFPRTTYFLSE